MIKDILIKTEQYKENSPYEHRKEQGQFFTSERIAEMMGSYFKPENRRISVIEPGAGNGILSAAVIKHLADRHMCEEINLTLVENDRDVIPLLNISVSTIREYCNKRGIQCNISVIEDNFILEDYSNNYDLVICNPPYKKIKKNSEESSKMLEYVHGQPNLYALFMVKGIELLKDGGTYIFITPRSWTSGAYFYKVRKALFNSISIEKIHIFNSRNNAFSEEDVLQETMILFGKKDQQSKSITISVSEDDSLNEMMSFEVNAEAIKGIGENEYLLIPSTLKEVKLISDMMSLTETFESLGYIFRTGPVVEFRNKEYISNRDIQDYVPMFRSLNIKDEGFTFPVLSGKAQYVSKDAKHLLIRNDNTVLIRRLSAKEECRRMQSCIYYRQGNFPFVSVENHVNYVVRADGVPLSREEVNWIHSLLSSDEYDCFFRIMNGSTQVNAHDLNRLPVRRVS